MQGSPTFPWIHLSFHFIWGMIPATGLPSMHRYPSDIRTERIFCPVMPHPKGIRNSGYIITPAKTPAEASAIARNPSWEIIRNDSLCQAVRFKDETWMIAFYSPGSVPAGKDKLTVDKPCLILLSENHLYAGNPSGREEIIKLGYGKDIRMITLPANGLTTKCIKLSNNS